MQRGFQPEDVHASQDMGCAINVVACVGYLRGVDHNGADALRQFLEVLNTVTGGRGQNGIKRRFERAIDLEHVGK